MISAQINIQVIFKDNISQLNTINSLTEQKKIYVTTNNSIQIKPFKNATKDVRNK